MMLFGFFVVDTAISKRFSMKANLVSAGTDSEINWLLEKTKTWENLRTPGNFLACLVKSGNSQGDFFNMFAQFSKLFIAGQYF